MLAQLHLQEPVAPPFFGQHAKRGARVGHGVDLHVTEIGHRLEHGQSLSRVLSRGVAGLHLQLVAGRVQPRVAGSHAAELREQYGLDSQREVPLREFMRHVEQRVQAPGTLGRGVGRLFQRLIEEHAGRVAVDPENRGPDKSHVDRALRCGHLAHPKLPTRKDRGIHVRPHGS